MEKLKSEIKEKVDSLEKNSLDRISFIVNEKEIDKIISEITETKLSHIGVNSDIIKNKMIIELKKYFVENHFSYNEIKTFKTLIKNPKPTNFTLGTNLFSYEFLEKLNENLKHLEDDTKDKILNSFRKSKDIKLTYNMGKLEFIFLMLTNAKLPQKSDLIINDKLVEIKVSEFNNKSGGRIKTSYRIRNFIDKHEELIDFLNYLEMKYNFCLMDYSINSTNKSIFTFFNENKNKEFSNFFAYLLHYMLYGNVGYDNKIDYINLLPKHFKENLFKNGYFDIKDIKFLNNFITAYYYFDEYIKDVNINHLYIVSLRSNKMFVTEDIKELDDYSSYFFELLNDNIISTSNSIIFNDERSSVPQIRLC